MSFSIGSFNFFDISDYPDEPRQSVALEARAGVNGHALWLTGTRGQIASVVTMRDFDTFANALIEFKAYRASIGASLDITWAGAECPKKFDILNVQQVPAGIKKMVLGIGGYTASVTGALLICQWTIVPTIVDRTPPEP